MSKTVIERTVVVAQAVVAPAVKKIKIKLKPHLMALVKKTVAAVVEEPVAVVEEPVAVVEKPVAVVEEPVMKQSLWMRVSRIKKTQPPPVVWENVEDISDDENDTPQAAGKRLSTLKATRDEIRRRAYENKLAALQGAGLLLKWCKPKLLETHDNYDYDVQSTDVYPIKRV